MLLPYVCRLYVLPFVWRVLVPVSRRRRIALCPHNKSPDSPLPPHSSPCREGCSSCGTGLTTDADGSASSDDCYVPAGWGTARDAQGVLSAAKCPVNTYGRENNTYGLVDVECTKCLDNSHTNQDASTNAAQCLTNSGYGYYGACRGTLACWRMLRMLILQ